MLFAKTKRPTPVLNTPDFTAVFSHPLPVCDQGLLRPIELIALPETTFDIIKQVSESIYQITMPTYPSSALFVDERFLSFLDKPHTQPTTSFPSEQTLLDILYSRIGLAYIWGGNWSEGIPELLDYYPPSKRLTEKERTLHTLTGVDCSGLLYEATNGLTPRNTSELLSYGKGVPIERKSPEAIALALQPLDLIVWKGHVVIVGRRGESIESHRLHGVVVTKLSERLHQLMEEKRPSNQPLHDPDTFVIRRWFKSALLHELSPQEGQCLHSK